MHGWKCVCLLRSAGQHPAPAACVGLLLQRPSAPPLRARQTRVHRPFCQRPSSRSRCWSLGPGAARCCAVTPSAQASHALLVHPGCAAECAVGTRRGLLLEACAAASLGCSARALTHAACLPACTASLCPRPCCLPADGCLHVQATWAGGALPSSSTARQPGDQPAGALHSRAAGSSACPASPGACTSHW